MTRTRVLSRQAAIASLAGLTVVASAGCSGSSLDKAGGAQAVNPVVLTMANINGPPEELQPFASAVAVPIWAAPSNTSTVLPASAVPVRVR